MHELAKRLTPEFDITTLCPRERGSAHRELRDNVNVIRYRYAPNTWSTLVSNGGIAGNLKCNRIKWLLVPFFLLAQTFATWRTINKLKPDYVHCHWIIPQGLCLYLALRLTSSPPPVLMTSHGGDLYTFRGKLATYLKKRVLLSAKAITVVSSAMKDAIANIGVDTSNTHVIPMGIDTQNRFKPNPNIERSKTEILFVGRLVEKKGLRYLLEALPEIARTVPEVSLTVIGEGPERKTLEEQCAELELTKKVNFLGSVKNQDLPAHYQRAATFIAPFVTADSGDEEGYGLVVAEALCCDCPVIVSKIDATQDLRSGYSDHQHLLAVPPASPQAISEAVLEMLGDTSIETTDGTEFRKIVDWDSTAYHYAKTLSYRNS